MVLTFNEFIIQLNYYEVFGNSPVKGKEKKESHQTPNSGETYLLVTIIESTGPGVPRGF